MKQKTIAEQGRRMALAACGLLVGAAMMQSCKDEVLTGQPEWLGNSIYERLQEEPGGKYSTVLRLIDDLKMKDVLGHTGSRTIFVADDDAYAKWYQTNSWGVKSYDQLTDAQKNILLKNSMINSAYLIELMSNSYMNGAIVEGMAMRRNTTASVFDSVYIMKPSEMPNTPAWAKLREAGKPIAILKDNNTAPMIHFLPSYMTMNKITSEDLSVLTNKQATSINEAWVNGKKVVERDITCKNGYIQKVDGVIEQNLNMAEIIRQHPNMSTWSRLLDRFSAPVPNTDAKREYNRIYNNEDPIYVLRYFSKASQDASQLNYYYRDPSDITQGMESAPDQLAFDPGLNHYMYKNEQYDMYNDAGAMIVPTNDAIEAWWNTEGLDLQQEYKELDSIPATTLVALINNHMLSSFSSSVPSKFKQVTNDAKEELGITKDDVDSCFVGCNGVVYMVNKVFAPGEYSSVVYPATAHQSTMSVIYWALSVGGRVETSNEDNRGYFNLNFMPYLLSMDSQYAFLLPDNDAMKMYLDPSTYGNMMAGSETPDLIEFTFDETAQSLEDKVIGSRYRSTVDADGNVVKNGTSAIQAKVDRRVVNKMLADLVDQLIIVMPDKEKTLEWYVEHDYKYFKTKGGSLIKVVKMPNDSLAFIGGWQMEHGDKQLPASGTFQKANGRTYTLNSQMPLTAQKSLYMTLQEHPEYEGFLKLLENSYCDLLSVKMSTYTPALSKLDNKNLRLFDNYNYTVFVPSTDAITQLQNEKKLPTWEELEKLYSDNDKHPYENILDSICENEGWYQLRPTLTKDSVQLLASDCLTSIVNNFIRYHVMDRSVAVGMPQEPGMTEGNYESMMRNPDTRRFYGLHVEYDQYGMTVTDVMGNTRTISDVDGLYNNICREYWLEGTGNLARLYMSSHAVAHLISEPLYYQDMEEWREVVKKYILNN